MKIKTLFLALAALLTNAFAERPITGPIVARVDSSFSYGLDVTWLRNPVLLNRASVISIEWNGIEKLAHAGPFKVGEHRIAGIVYIFDFDVSDVPAGAIVRVVK